MHPSTIPDLDSAGLRNFAITTAAIVAVLFGVALPWAFSLAYPKWPWILAAALSAWGLVAPATLNGVYRGWMRFGLIMGKITTPLILGIVYFIIISPMAFVMRIRGRDPLHLARETHLKTYRKPSPPMAKNTMEKPF